MQTADYFIPSSEFLAADELGFDDIFFEQKIMKLNRMVAGSLIVTFGAQRFCVEILDCEGKQNQCPPAQASWGRANWRYEPGRN